MSRWLTRRRVLVSLGVTTVALAGGGAYLFLGARPADAAGTVVKSPLCGCCGAWVEHMAAAGLPLAVENVVDLAPTKRSYGIPAALESCHTAVIDGYVIEGHVPAAQVTRLLEERPDIRGLAVPGMPIGSPGMEGPNPEPYTVLALHRDGRTSAFARVSP